MASQTLHPIVRNPREIKLALVGKVVDDDHPYSWSAILNGYDGRELARCPNRIIRRYLTAQPHSNFGISGVKVTHIWCDHVQDSKRVARFSSIPNVVRRAEDVVGAVDAVLIPTDKGEEHLARARPFVEAGLPVFIDKPLTISEDHLRTFVRWQKQGKALMSSSCMRFAQEFIHCQKQIGKVGALRVVTVTTCRTWERYGIHALEAAYLFDKPGGWESVTYGGTAQAAVVRVTHRSGLNAVIPVVEDMDGAFGHLALYGTKGALTAHFVDSFFAFKAQLAAFVQYLRSGRPPYPFAETVELMKIVIAGLRSRNAGGRTILLSEVAKEI
jgi:predicted dehydrogenase